MSVAVTDGKTMLLSEGFGLADRTSGKPVGEHTLFRLASISKPITAVGVMRLVQDGKIHLEDDIRKYVPGFPDKGETIRVQDILSQTSGIRHYVAGKNDNAYDEVSTDDAIRKFAADPLVAIPDEKFTYSTHAFTLLAKAVETVEQRPFVDFMRKEVLPFGGGELDFEVASDVKPERSSLYILDATVVQYNKRENLSWKFAGGGMEGTADSILKFCESVRRGEVISPEIRDLMWTPTTYRDGSRNRYGLGWLVTEDGRVHHGGSQQGCSSMLHFDPKTGAGVVVLANSQNADVAKLADQLMDMISTPGKPLRRR